MTAMGADDTAGPDRGLAEDLARTALALARRFAAQAAATPGCRQLTLFTGVYGPKTTGLPYRNTGTMCGNRIACNFHSRR